MVLKCNPDMHVSPSSASLGHNLNASLSRIDCSLNCRSFPETFQSWKEKEDCDWLCTVELPDSHIPTIDEYNPLVGNQQPLVRVETHCHMLQTAQNIGGDEKVKGGMQYIAWKEVHTFAILLCYLACGCKMCWMCLY